MSAGGLIFPVPDAYMAQSFLSMYSDSSLNNAMYSRNSSQKKNKTKTNKPKSSKVKEGKKNRPAWRLFKKTSPSDESVATEGSE